MARGPRWSRTSCRCSRASCTPTLDAHAADAARRDARALRRLHRPRCARVGRLGFRDGSCVALRSSRRAREPRRQRYGLDAADGERLVRAADGCWPTTRYAPDDGARPGARRSTTTWPTRWWRWSCPRSARRRDDRRPRRRRRLPGPAAGGRAARRRRSRWSRASARKCAFLQRAATACGVPQRRGRHRTAPRRGQRGLGALRPRHGPGAGAAGGGGRVRRAAAARSAAGCVAWRGRRDADAEERGGRSGRRQLGLAVEAIRPVQPVSGRRAPPSARHVEGYADTRSASPPPGDGAASGPLGAAISRPSDRVAATVR